MKLSPLLLATLQGVPAELCFGPNRTADRIAHSLEVCQAANRECRESVVNSTSGVVSKIGDIIRASGEMAGERADCAAIVEGLSKVEELDDCREVRDTIMSKLTTCSQEVGTLVCCMFINFCLSSSP